MGTQVCSGAAMTCSFGAAPSTLTVLPDKMVHTSNLPAATIMDNKPMVNIMPFGVCMSPSNPTVASATAAAMGVLTPMPCIPMTASPWTPGSATVLIKSVPALQESSTLMCNWGGVIAITTPGQFTHHVP